MATKRVDIVLGARDRSQSVVRRFEQRMGRVLTRVAQLGAVASTAAAAGLGAMTKASFASIDATAKFADSIGLTTQQLVGYQEAARLTGASNNQLNTGFARLLKNVADGADGLSTSRRAFDKLGLSVDDLRRMRTDRVIKVVMDRLREIENPADRAQVALQLFGRAGVGLIKMAEQGSHWLEEVQGEVVRTGRAFNRLDAAKVEEANDRIGDLRSSVMGLAHAIAIGLAPALTQGAAAATDQVVAMRQMDEAQWSAIQSGGLLAASVVASAVAYARYGSRATRVMRAVRVATVAERAQAAALLLSRGRYVGAAQAAGVYRAAAMSTAAASRVASLAIGGGLVGGLALAATAFIKARAEGTTFGEAILRIARDLKVIDGLALNVDDAEKAFKSARAGVLEAQQAVTNEQDPEERLRAQMELESRLKEQMVARQRLDELMAKAEQARARDQANAVSDEPRGTIVQGPLGNGFVPNETPEQAKARATAEREAIAASSQARLDAIRSRTEKQVEALKDQARAVRVAMRETQSQVTNEMVASMDAGALELDRRVLAGAGGGGGGGGGSPGFVTSWALRLAGLDAEGSAAAVGALGARAAQFQRELRAAMDENVRAAAAFGAGPLRQGLDAIERERGELVSGIRARAFFGRLSPEDAASAVEAVNRAAQDKARALRAEQEGEVLGYISTPMENELLLIERQRREMLKRVDELREVGAVGSDLADRLSREVDRAAAEQRRAAQGRLGDTASGQGGLTERVQLAAAVEVGGQFRAIAQQFSAERRQEATVIHNQERQMGLMSAQVAVLERIERGLTGPGSGRSGGLVLGLD